MIKAQEEVLGVCEKLHTTANQAELSDDKIVAIDKIQETVAQQRLLVPVVGHFSSGKSTMINTILGENILPTGITP